MNLSYALSKKCLSYLLVSAKKARDGTLSSNPIRVDQLPSPRRQREDQQQEPDASPAASETSSPPQRVPRFERTLARQSGRQRREQRPLNGSFPFFKRAKRGDQGGETVVEALEVATRVSANLFFFPADAPQTDPADGEPKPTGVGLLAGAFPQLSNDHPFELEAVVRRGLNEIAAGDVFLIELDGTTLLDQMFKAGDKRASAVIAFSKEARSPFDQVIYDHLLDAYETDEAYKKAMPLPLFVVAKRTPGGNKFLAQTFPCNVKIIVGNPNKDRAASPSADQTESAEEQAAQQRRKEVRTVKQLRKARTAPPHWVTQQEAELLGLDWEAELAYINKSLLQRSNFIIHPDHEADFSFVLCTRCGAKLRGDAAKAVKVIWHSNYATHMDTKKCREQQPIVALPPKAQLRKEQAEACTRNLPVSIAEAR